MSSLINWQVAAARQQEMRRLGLTASRLHLPRAVRRSRKTRTQGP